MRRLNWFGFWTVLGIVSSAQLYFAHQRLGPDPYTWWQALTATLPDWYLWALLSLVVVWLARRFRVDRASFGRHFFIHLGASLDLALLHLIAAVEVQNLLHAARGEAYPFAQRLVDHFTILFHWNVLIYWAILAVVHALDYHRDLEERRERAAALEAQLQALNGAPAGGEPAGRRPAERLLVADTGRSFFVRTADVKGTKPRPNNYGCKAGGPTKVVRSPLAPLAARSMP